MASKHSVRRALDKLGELARPPESSELDDKVPEAPPIERLPMNNRSPFSIGFFVAIGAFSALGVLMAISQLQNVLLLIGLSLFLALGLNPSVEWLHARKVPRSLAVVVVALVVLGIVGLAIWALLPVVSHQVQILINNAPYYLQVLRENPQMAQWDEQYHIIEKVTAFLATGGWVNSLYGGILGASKVVANTLFSVIMTLVLTLYFLASLPSFKNVIYQLAPRSRRPRVKFLADEMFSRVGGYMTGLFIVVFCSTTVAFVFMNLVGLGSYSLALSVVVAMFAFIPLVGSTGSMVIVSLVAFSQNTTMGIITLVFFLTYQQIDTYVIQPRVYASSVNVPGIVVIVGALSGGILFGVIGAFMAIPTAAVLLLLYREVLLPRIDRM